MNPKTLTTEQMFGHLVGNNWIEGVFTYIWRYACKIVHKMRPWIVIDGPVDSLWIENLNTALDNTRMLTLPNSERLPVPDSLRILIEV